MRLRLSAWAQLVPLIGIALFLCMYVAFGVAGMIGMPLAVAGIVIFGAVLIVGTVGVLKVRGSRWELRLDKEGVTVRGHELIPWAEFVEVRVTGMRPRWIFWASKFLGYRMVSFIGKPGVTVPPMPSFSYAGSFERRAGKVRVRWYGSRLVIMPRSMNVPTAAITAAIRGYSSVRITYS